MASIISYLENYVEGTLGLPSDLSRFLNMIRVLDDRVADLSVAIKGTTEALCALEPVGGRKGTPAEQVGPRSMNASRTPVCSHARSRACLPRTGPCLLAATPLQPPVFSHVQEYSSLIATFKRQEALLYQFSEEKVQLAQHALELIARYHKELDTVRPRLLLLLPLAGMCLCCVVRLCLRGSSEAGMAWFGWQCAMVKCGVLYVPCTPLHVCACTWPACLITLQ